MSDIPRIAPVRSHPKETELAARIDNLILEYSGEISYVSVAGVLAMLSWQYMLDQVEARNEG